MTEGRVLSSSWSTRRVSTTTARPTAISTARKLFVWTIISSIPVILAQNNTAATTVSYAGTTNNSLYSNVVSLTPLPTELPNSNGKFTTFENIVTLQL